MELASCGRGLQQGEVVDGLLLKVTYKPMCIMSFGAKDQKYKSLERKWG